MKISTVVTLALFLSSGTLLAAQDAKRPVFSHPLAIPSAGQRHDLTSPAPDTVRVLAAMVAFQTDADDRTTGDGTFDLSDTLGRVIDAAPHNRSYFFQHLTFLSNYYRKVSDGKTTVVFDMLDSVYRMPHQMGYYSPPRSSTDNLELGTLIQDVWHTVDSVTPGAITQRQYDTYVIFHAGAGRDIDLTALYGYDPTPLDLPSLYVSLAALRQMFGASYPGVLVAGGTRAVTNSMILPESESRLLPTAIGKSLLELSINGLLCASLGSHLNLPDLFDTKTGATGIGRFGLMDGQSIFSWNGLFPPEPSAWERYYLGWVQPVVIPGGDNVYDVPAVSLAAQSDSIYKVLINEKEYFLVENRNRDANRDGATVSMVIHDSVFTRTWHRDTTGFNAFSTSALFGVITDVDEFDWSLPGGVSSSTGEWYDGGLLIWHIDEGVIDSTIASDAVNANPDRRGVNLMEADGSQDIGQSYGFLSPGSGSENGTPLDFWYDGNRATLRLQSNAFTPTSHPSSNSNSGANSHITMKDFSTRSPHMTLQIAVGDEHIAPLAGFPAFVDTSAGRGAVKVARLVNVSYGDIAVVTGPDLLGRGRVRAWSTSGQNIDSALFSSRDIVRAGFALRDPAGAPLLDTAFVHAHASQRLISPVANDTVLAAGIGDSVFILGVSGGVLNRLGVSSSGISLFSRSGEFLSAGRDSSVHIFTKDGVQSSANLGHPLVTPPAAGFLSPAAPNRIVAASADGYVYALNSSLSVSDGFPVRTGSQISAPPALADVDGDGRRDIVVCSENRIYALNAGGVLLDHFPVQVPSPRPILAPPVVADVNGDGMPDIVVVTQEGLVLAYDRTGKLLDGFPLAAGTNGGSPAAAFYLAGACLSCIDVGVAVASLDGYVYAWKTGSLRTGLQAPPDQPWPQVMRDAGNTALADSVLPGQIFRSEFLPKDRAYNWPNPVDKAHGFLTHIRYYVASDATVVIKVFDLAGELVAELSGPGQAGIDNEVTWDVSGVQSGVYLAHIDARGTGGSGSAVIKIAVVK